MEIDKELSAIRRVGNIVKDLTPFQRTRVLRFVMDGFDEEEDCSQRLSTTDSASAKRVPSIVIAPVKEP